MEYLLEARSIIKRYGHVEALRGADFDVQPGEIVGLVGDNGAGKSTLVKTLSGAISPDAGTLLLDGHPITFDRPAEARARGIETVYQDLALAPDLDVTANMYLGREVLRPGLLGRLGVLHKGAMRGRTAEYLRDLNVTIRDHSSTVASLSGGQRQGVAVARAAVWAKRLIFLDEPTAALGVQQTAQVEELTKRIRDNGIAVVLISHNMQQVLALADRIQVLRLGQRVATFQARDTDPQTLVTAITGLYQQDTGAAQRDELNDE